MKRMVMAVALAVVAAGVVMRGSSEPLRAKHGMVVSVQATASKIGADVLKDGGNAIDAAVAVGFALAVTHPTAGNLGGGGFFVYRPANGEPVTYDFREMAPAKAHRRDVLERREIQRRSPSPQPHRRRRARNGGGHAHGLEGARQAPVEAARRTGDRAGTRRLPDDRELRALAGGRVAEHEEVSGVGRAVLEERRAVRGRRDLQAARSREDAAAHRRQGAGGLLRGRDRGADRKGDDGERRADHARGSEELRREAARAGARHLPRLRHHLDAADQLGRRGARSRC